MKEFTQTDSFRNFIAETGEMVDKAVGFIVTNIIPSLVSTVGSAIGIIKNVIQQIRPGITATLTSIGKLFGEFPKNVPRCLSCPKIIDTNAGSHSHLR